MLGWQRKTWTRQKYISRTKFLSILSFAQPQIGVHRATVQCAFVANINKVWGTALQTNQTGPWITNYTYIKGVLETNWKVIVGYEQMLETNYRWVRRLQIERTDEFFIGNAQYYMVKLNSA